MRFAMRLASLLAMVALSLAQSTDECEQFRQVRQEARNLFRSWVDKSHGTQSKFTLLGVQSKDDCNVILENRNSYHDSFAIYECKWAIHFDDAEKADNAAVRMLGGITKCLAVADIRRLKSSKEYIFKVDDVYFVVGSQTEAVFLHVSTANDPDMQAYWAQSSPALVP